MMRLARYLWVLLVIAALGAVVLGNVAASESDGPDEDRCPVTASHMAWMDLNLGSIYYDNMTTAQKEADVARFYVDGEVITQGWIESAKLFRASFLLAIKQPLRSKARKHLLKIALKGAERCLQQKPDTMVIALAPWKLRMPDEWFCRELLRIYSNRELHFEHEAVRAYCASLLYEALGERNSAWSSMEEAYLLAPEDSIVSCRIKRMRKNGGDFSGALDAIAQSEPHNRPDSIPSLIDRANHEFDKAEVFLAAKNVEKALLHGQNCWESLDALEAMRSGDTGVTGMSLMGLRRNRCATVCGLAAFQKGDVEGAVKWLEASLTHGQFVKMLGYDLRLARKLSTVPSAREAVITYLQKASRYGLPKSKEDAQKLFKQVRQAKLAGRR